MTTAIPLYGYAPKWVDTAPHTPVRVVPAADLPVHDEVVPDGEPARRGAVRVLGALVMLASGLAAISGAFLPWSVTRGNVTFSGLDLLAKVPQPPQQVAIALGALLTLSGLWCLAARKLPGGVWFIALALGIVTAVVGLNEITAIQRGNDQLGSAIGNQGLLALVKIGMHAGIGVHLQVWAGAGAAVGALLCAVRPRTRVIDPYAD
jgi:hypothetical protein